MALQKKINKLQVEHVSEEEVDQLFYALELKEQQLAQAQRDKAGLEQEVQTLSKDITAPRPAGRAVAARAAQDPTQSLHGMQKRMAWAKQAMRQIGRASCRERV